MLGSRCLYPEVVSLILQREVVFLKLDRIKAQKLCFPGFEIKVQISQQVVFLRPEISYNLG